MEVEIKNWGLKQARKIVRRMRDFYNHLQISIIIIIIIMLFVLLFSNTFIDFFESYIENKNSLEKVKVNIWINVLLWLIALVMHGLFVFKFKMNVIDDWEENKVAEFMNGKE
jgi:uncharacterized membrane protein (DUF485 family)